MILLTLFYIRKIKMTTTLPDEMTCYISQFLEDSDQMSLSNTNVNNHNAIVDMKKALEKRRTIEKDAIETLLKSIIDKYIVDCSIPTIVFLFEKLTAYLDQFKIYDDSIIDENGLFKNNPTFTSDTRIDLLKTAIEIAPEKAFEVGMKLIEYQEDPDNISDVIGKFFSNPESYHNQREYGKCHLTQRCGYKVTFISENDASVLRTSPSNVDIYGGNVTHVPSHPLFYHGNITLQTVILSDSVTSIYDKAFQHCQHLQCVRLSESLESIGESAFEGCTMLKQILIPSSVTTLGDSIFEECHSLVSIVLPPSIQSIPSGTFADCKNLRTVSIPSSVTVIYDFAFYGCSNLESVTSGEEGLWCTYVPKSIKTSALNAFMGCPYESSMEKYRSSDIPDY
jgi:hypothetical protein